MAQTKKAGVYKKSKCHSLIVKYRGEDFNKQLIDEVPRDDTNTISYLCDDYNNVEHHNGRNNWMNDSSFEKFEKYMLKVIDVLQHCNCLQRWIFFKYDREKEQEKIDRLSDTDERRVGVPYSNLCLVPEAENSHEAIAYCIGEQDYVKQEQFFKYDQDLVCKGSISMPDKCCVQQSDDDSVSTDSHSIETTILFTNPVCECMDICSAVQETTSTLSTADGDHQIVLSDHHSYITPPHLRKDCQPKNREFYAAPTQYWRCLTAILNVPDLLLSVLDNCFQEDEKEDTNQTAHLPWYLQDCELQTPYTSEIQHTETSDNSNIVRLRGLQDPNKRSLTCQTSNSPLRQRTHHRRFFSLVNLLLLSSATLSCVSGSVFVEVPVTEKVPIGAEATFRCQSPTAIIILWRVNGSLVGRNPPRDITPSITRDDNGSLVDTLTIIAQPEYNETEVVCVVSFSDGRPEEQTAPALLIVVMNSSTTEPEPTIQKGKFILSPVSLNVTLNEVVVFNCQHSTAFGINWRINGTNLLRDSPAGVTSTTSDGISTLTITALSEYNQTVIVCEALFRNSPSEETEPATVMIQGNLESVTEIHRTSSMLFWTPPSSLDLTAVDPDIVYCVEVYNTTCGKRDLIVSDCNVTEPSYTFDVIAPDGYIYEYIVTPRSNVEEARNGTPSQPIEDELPNFSVNSTFFSIENDRNGTYQTTLNFREGDISVPSTYTLSLTSVDGLEDMDSVKTTTIKHDAHTITINVISGLPLKRLWNCTILAYGCKDHPILTGAELSTHDIQNISVSTPLPGQIRVTGDFIERSAATGFITITISSSQIIYYDLVQKGFGKSHVEGVLSGFSGGQHSMSLFVVEEDGLPFQRVAIKPRIMSVDENNVQRQPYIVEYEFQPTLTGACITCTFLDSSTTDCVVVVHQRISQLSSSGLMNIEASHKFNRSGDNAYGCIKVNMDSYQIGVIGGRKLSSQPDRKNSVAVIASSVLATVLILLAVMVIVIIFLVVVVHTEKRRKQLHLLRHTHDVEQHSDPNNYEIILPKQNMEHTRERELLISDSRTEFDNQADDQPAFLPRIQFQPLTMPHVSHNEETGSPGPENPYAELVTSNTTISSPSAVEKKKDDTVNSHLNQQDQQYAMLVHSTSKCHQVLDDLNKTEYSQIISSQQPQVKGTTNEDDKCGHQCHPSQTPFTVENLLTLLHVMISQWKLLGEMLSLDDDDLDEIFTNNPTEDACLQDVLERYMMNYDFEHNWNEMSNILRKIGQDIVAEKIYDLHIRPYKISLPGQTEQKFPTEAEVAVIHTKRMLNEEMQTEELQIEGMKHATESGILEKHIQRESIVSCGSGVSVDAKSNEVSVNLCVSENETEKCDYEGISEQERTNALEMQLCDALAQESSEQGEGFQVVIIQTGRNVTQRTLTVGTKTEGMLGGETGGKQIGVVLEGETGIVGYPVEEQIQPKESKEAGTEKALTGDIQHECLSDEKVHTSGPTSHAAVEGSSECMDSGGSNDDSQSAPADSSASEDEGYCSNKGNCTDMIHSTQQREPITEAVQPQSTENPKDRVLVHASSQQPTILSSAQDRTESKKIEHINDKEIQVHNSEYPQSEELVFSPGINHGIADAEETGRGVVIIHECPCGLSKWPANIKIFGKTCDISHTETEELPSYNDVTNYKDAPPSYEQLFGVNEVQEAKVDVLNLGVFAAKGREIFCDSDQLEYFSQLIPSLTLPNHLITTFKKVVTRKLRDGIMKLTLEEPSEDVANHEYDKDADNEQDLKTSPDCSLCVTDQADLHLSVESSSCDAKERVKVDDSVCPGKSFKRNQLKMVNSIPLTCTLRPSTSKAKISRLWYPHKQDHPTSQKDSSMTAKNMLLFSSFAPKIAKPRIVKVQPGQVGQSLSKFQRTQLYRGKVVPNEASAVYYRKAKNVRCYKPPVHSCFCKIFTLQSAYYGTCKPSSFDPLVYPETSFKAGGDINWFLWMSLYVNVNTSLSKISCHHTVCVKVCCVAARFTSTSLSTYPYPESV